MCRRVYVEPDILIEITLNKNLLYECFIKTKQVESESSIGCGEARMIRFHTELVPCGFSCPEETSQAIRIHNEMKEASMD